MEITFYSAIDPRRFLNKSFKSLADVAPVLSQNGEGITIDAQGETTCNEIIPVDRDLTITGKVKACFELHGNTTLTLNHAQLVNIESSGTTIKLASDYTGSIKIVDSTIAYRNKIGGGFGINTDVVDWNTRPMQIYIQNSTIEGMAAMPLRLIMRGQVNIYSKSQHDFSAISASRIDGQGAKINARYASLINNNVEPAQLLECVCEAGPVQFEGNWNIQTLVVNSSKSMELFSFTGSKQLPSKIKLRKLTIAKHPNGISAFYASETELVFEHATLGDTKNKIAAAIHNCNIYMKNTNDRLDWQLDGHNGLELDKKSLTKLRLHQKEFSKPQSLFANEAQIVQPNSNKDNHDLDLDMNYDSSTEASTNHENTTQTPIKPIKQDQLGDQGLLDAKQNQDANAMSEKERGHKDVQHVSGMQQLNNLIGLASVKKTLQTFINRASVNRNLEKRGLKRATDLARHMVFEGPPGTGKTTVAEIVAKILFEKGAIRRSYCKSVDSANIVSDHIGGTAKAMHKAVMDASGGVLFIDEAYMLDPTYNDNKFAQDAADTLMRDMEKYHADLIVIIAGYEKPMENFLKHVNQGLSSRFAYKVHFPSYTTKEELEIFQVMLKKNGLLMNPAFMKTKMFLWNLQFFNRDHSNARDVRNYCQALMDAQANRIVDKGMARLSDKQMISIEAADIKTVYKQNIAKLKYERKQKAEQKKQMSSPETTEGGARNA